MGATHLSVIRPGSLWICRVGRIYLPTLRSVWANEEDICPPYAGYLRPCREASYTTMHMAPTRAANATITVHSITRPPVRRCVGTRRNARRLITTTPKAITMAAKAAAVEMTGEAVV